MTVQEALDELGDSEVKVLNTLHSWGVQGRRGQPSLCPVAKYLRLRGHSALVFPDMIMGDEEDFIIETPGPVTDFLISFDQGRYPTLINRNRHHE